jgi:hypothetical protein
MALTKQFVKSKSLYKVTFQVNTEGNNISVLGDFNSWNPEALILKKQKDGSFKGTAELEAGREFQFRYLVDNTLWLNDESSDKFVWNGISSEENSVIVL